MDAQRIVAALARNRTVSGYYAMMFRERGDAGAEINNHMRRVAVTGLQLAINLGYEENLMDLAVGCLLHDIGKLNVPERIISKPGKLDENERMEMERHVRYGVERVRHEVSPEALFVIGSHHEYSRQPYPRSGEERRILREATPGRRTVNSHIEPLAQCCAAADMYDALRSPRPYKGTLTIDQSLTIIRADWNGDPKVIEVLAELAR